MLQALMNASNAQGAAAGQADLPDDISLPLNSLASMSQLDDVLQDKEKLKALVTSLFKKIFLFIFASRNDFISDLY